VSDLFLGIDIGTSAVKALLIDDRHRQVAQASSPLEISRPQPLWSEQDPRDWWTATCTAIDALRAAAGARWRDVRAIGLAGQMHGAVLLDAADRPLRPAILWNDGRALAECHELENRWPALTEVTGNRAMPGFTAPKLVWVARHEPGIFAQVRRVLLPKDYVRLQMTGTAATDASDAAGTLWLDVGRRAWSDDALEVTGLTVSHMPAVFEGTAATGTLRDNCLAQWGLSRGVTVAAGAGDNAAGALGLGTLQAGDAFLSLGTSGVTFVAQDRFVPCPDRGVHTFCHAVPERWHQMAVHLSAASALSWAAALLGFRDVSQLLAEVDPSNPACDPGLFFLPYLSGERTPHNDPRAVGVLHGLTHSTGRREVARAVLEGVAFAFADGIEALKSSGTPIGELAAIGGGARSDLWLQIMADVLGRPLRRPAGPEAGPSLGAARLAGVASGIWQPADAFIRPEFSQPFEPDPRHAERYATALPRFRSLYRPALAPADMRAGSPHS
jgi:xylulokinase